MSQINSPQNPTPDNDAFLHLHRMSTTAGVSSEDYVAVNVTSVIAVLFGLASLLAVFNNIMLVFPVVGVILSIAAIRQVSNSNGTQTGKGFAILGLVLSGVITAGIFSIQAVQDYQRRTDEQALNDLCDKYSDYVTQEKYDQAYDLFDSDFKNRVSKEAFTAHLITLQHRPDVPPMTKIAWNGMADFHSGDNGAMSADAVIKVSYKGMTGDDREPAHFHKAGDGPWLIDDLSDQFPPIKSGQSQQ